MDDTKARLETELGQINSKLDSPKIYSDPEYPKLAKRRSEIENILGKYTELELARNNKHSAQNLKSTGDIELQKLASDEVSEQDKKISQLTDEILELITPADPNNDRNVIIEIRAAAGGDEASLFAADLYRMYVRWAEKNHYKVELLNESPNITGGFKEISFKVSGEEAYKYLKFEAGVHRVQRIPTTESQGRIHTSTITVAVLPEATESDVEINPSDIRVDVYRSSGHGGQSVNTTDSAVRITHLPTGLVVANQDEKSQIKNKAKALSILRSRLLQRKIEDDQQQLSEARRKLIGSGDRSEKIRTYNFPQDRITDHRIGYSRGNMQSAMDGDISDIIDNLLSAEHELLNQEK